MTTLIINYRELTVNSTGKLHEITNMPLLKQIISDYMDLLLLVAQEGWEEISPEQYQDWITRPCKELPKASVGNTRERDGYRPIRYQSIGEWLSGIHEKITRPRGNDLSTSQMKGIETLSEMLKDHFMIPSIKFKSWETRFEKASLPKFFEVQK